MNAKKKDGELELESEQEEVLLTFPGVEGHEGAKLTLDQAEELIKTRKKSLREVTNINTTIPVFPWDGAYAFDRVMKRLFGGTQGQTIKSFWGDTPPTLINVETSFGVFEEVPFGRVTVPKASGGGYIDLAHTDPRRGPVQFTMAAMVMRKDAPVINRIYAEVRKELQTNSIYRGKAIKIRFTDEEGKVLSMPKPTFIDTSKINPAQLVLTKDLTQQVQTNVFTPFERLDDMLADGEPVKRTILLAGPFGVGKSLTAQIASKLAEENNITFVLVEQASDLTRGLDFAKQYQTNRLGCAVVCEDVDREVMGVRTPKMDELLNVVDGVDSKTVNLITIMTTNNMELIHPAMVRRFDAVIEFTVPDAEAVERLVRSVAGDTVAPEENLSEVGRLLAGTIPSIVSEVVKRSKLSQRSLQPKGMKVTKITGEALALSAKSMRPHMQLLEQASAKPQPLPTVDQAFGGLVQRAVGQVMGNGASA